MKVIPNFHKLTHGEIIILPKKYINPATQEPFDFIQLAGDYIIFGLSTKSTVGIGGEYKTIREMYEERHK